MSLHDWTSYNERQTGSRPLYRDTDVVEFEETVEAVVLESEATPQQASA